MKKSKNIKKCDNCFFITTFCKEIPLLKKIDKQYKNISFLIGREKLILEIFKDNDRKLQYKMLEIKKLQDKLEVLIIPDYIKKYINTSELEELIFVINKQKKLVIPTQEKVKLIKQIYKPNTKIELIKMYDYINSVPSGTIGIVEFVDDIGNISVKWENGSTTNLIKGIDEYKILGEEK